MYVYIYIYGFRLEIDWIKYAILTRLNHDFQPLFAYIDDHYSRT